MFKICQLHNSDFVVGDFILIITLGDGSALEKLGRYESIQKKI